MIISASRRTDIPARYPEWFVNRLREGEVLVQNPYNRKKIQRIALSPETVDCIVFWSKNPEPVRPFLPEIDAMGYRYYFQMTITDYGADVEPGVPDTTDAMATFLLMSEQLGKERMDWRFDPILLSGRYTRDYHLEKFEMMCEWLHDATTRCIISFVDPYRGSPFRELEPEEIEDLAAGLGKIAGKYHLPLYSCAEKVDLTRFGIRPGACIDKEKIRQLAAYKLDVKKDPGQRKECGCVESIDIGVYDTCPAGCQYCYAVHSPESARNKYDQHDPLSPVLTGCLKGDETISDKEVHSFRDDQLSLFDLPEMEIGF
ncbi:DUF1848 domain-containing protein [uncultured Merdimonas sp.]|uniref:DUF1848 domain-containing protein n=1 Tax=uncultured Merdimonas sp. TaxID=2023269 RepID=UPI00320BAF96